MTRPLANVAASVRQRLLNRARESGRPFAELLQYYTMERFLYRLAVSKHSHKFVLKGALMLRVWYAPEARPTMDYRSARAISAKRSGTGCDRRLQAGGRGGWTRFSTLKL